MKIYNVITSIACACVFVSACVFSATAIGVDDLPTPVDGLSWTFYNKSCHDLEDIVKSTLDKALDKDISQAAGLLRLHFHDCFVQGCDGSVLLTGSGSEQEAPPNLTLRKRALQLIDEIKKAVEDKCKGRVSCADILALAARDSVHKAVGPEYPVPLGRRDSLKFASQQVVNANLPGPGSHLEHLMDIFSSKQLTLTDMVALSGAHTIGIAHCNNFDNRLYDRSTGEKIVDTTIDQSFASSLYKICPEAHDTHDSANLDLHTPDAFDKKYYVNVKNNEVLFTSDQSLYTDSTDDNSTESRKIVDRFASKQAEFFDKFSLAMHKMGQLNVLTGSQGEIRSKCSVPNPTPEEEEEVIESRSDDAHSEL